MLEVEMKFRVDDPAEYEKRLESILDMSLGPATVEEDEFYRCDALGFPDNGKMLRIRRRGNDLVATFKGPRLDDETKTREEIELPLASPSLSSPENSGALVERAQRDWSRFFQRLGFEPAARLLKTRRCARAHFDGREIEISVDSLEGLGFFTELETIAVESEFEAASATVKDLAERLGLKDAISKSYLALKIERELGREIVEP
ncbi:MAG: class IV adenylate cyclase [Thermoguttaceae bacterium]|jgi:adenylate cyclase class 2